MGSSCADQALRHRVFRDAIEAIHCRESSSAGYRGCTQVLDERDPEYETAELVVTYSCAEPFEPITLLPESGLFRRAGCRNTDRPRSSRRDPIGGQL